MKRESFIISCIRRLREYGEGIVLADQCISSLKEVAKSNVYTIVCLSQSSQRDRREVIGVLGLSPQQGEMTNKLKEGEGIVRMVGRYPYPVLLKFPFVKPRAISDKQIDMINENEGIIHELLIKVKSSIMIADANEKDKSLPEASYEKFDDGPVKKITKDLKKLLTTISKFPFEVSTQIMKKAGFSGSKGDRIKTYARDKGYILEHSMSLGVRGGNRKYLEITHDGYQLLDDLLEEYQRPKGKGDFEHRLFQNLVAKYYSSKGCHAEIEEREYIESNGQKDSWTLVDIGVQNPNGPSIAVEIELNINNQIICNIEHDLKAGYDRVVVVTKKELLDAVEKRVKSIPEEMEDKVKVKVISEFL